MDKLFIRGIKIDWNGVDVDNYIRKIPAIKSIDKLDFHSNITFFVGKMVQENQP